MEKGFNITILRVIFKCLKNYLTFKNIIIFIFLHNTPGVVFYKDKLEDVYEKTTIRTFSYAINILPPIIASRPLSLKRQEELYKEIAPYVDVPFREITCPKA
ncbi:uncharacterized protein OCT59_021496 [Rhizophagus irregularis]|uniref:uncharacterized protein n=1 Tax=Rhizophagus irregularis TaxID=588596 RepID=UPI00332F2373|nr:hypothetical protein OCT59_021496 [Rhizophagus irregularis]